MATVSEALAIAIQHHQAGRLHAAEQIYRQILEADPNQPDALHLLGVTALQLGEHTLAVKHISRAIELNATESGYHCNLGNAFQAWGKLEEAVDCFRRALQLNANNCLAHYNLGNVFQELGRLEEANASFRTALKLNPDHAAAHNNLGNTLQAQGKIDEAVASFRRAIELKPNHAEAHGNLGMVLSHQGQLDEAIACFLHALDLKPDAADAYYNLGNAYHNQGKLDEAIASYRQAIELNPCNAAAHNNLGNVLQSQGKSDEALACFRRALELNPDLPEAHNNLGSAFNDLRKLDEAVAYYRQALERRPDYAQAYYNLSVVFLRQGKFDRALACCRKALELKPDHPAAHSNLGNILKAQGQLDAAVACHRRAIELKPDYAEAHNNLGSVLQAERNLDEAVAAYRRALNLKPDFPEAHNNLGTALESQGKLDEAVASYRRALELKPNYAEAHSNLGIAFKDQGKFDEAFASYHRALEWNPEFLTAYHNLLYGLWFCPNFDSAAIYEAHSRWNQQCAQPLGSEIVAPANDATPNRRLRLGYVSPDFRNHCQAFFTLPLFSAHDRQQFEIVCYSDVPSPDSVTTQLQSRVDIWRNIVGQSDAELAQMIRQDQIDILVDLTMHMDRGHLPAFALKPAPVQVCWLAYPGTTGLTTIDYRLTDPYLDPHGLNDAVYSEQSIRLPDCFWCYDPLTDAPAVNALPALTTGRITFGCLNNFCKVNPAVLELWARVLIAVDQSRLLLLVPEGSARENVLQILASAGISADRITFVARQPRPTYLELYHQIDIGLDTFPYNGHTTSLDSFWMGVPVITLVGQTVVGRAGLCQLHNLGLPELIAHTPDQFVEISAHLANDLPRLSQIRAALRQTIEKSPLMDAPRFARNIEAAYRAMWHAWCASRSSSSSS